MSAVVVLIATYRVRNVGRIRAIGVEVFEDPACTSPLIEIDWGVLSAGDLAGVTVYIKNTQNVVFTLTLNTSDWNPPLAADYLSLDWNYTGKVLTPEQVLPVQLTLYVSVHVQNVTSFSFDILVVATEA